MAKRTAISPRTLKPNQVLGRVISEHSGNLNRKQRRAQDRFLKKEIRQDMIALAREKRKEDN